MFDVSTLKNRICINRVPIGGLNNSIASCRCAYATIIPFGRVVDGNSDDLELRIE